MIGASGKPAIERYPMPTRARLTEVLKYCTETGTFTWIVRKAGIRINSIAGSVNSNGYVFIKIDGHCFAAHKLAWLMHYGVEPGMSIDHINCVKTDNSIANLRLCTASQNGANQKLIASNTSGKKGVTYHAANKKWQAQIKIGKKLRYLGTFDTAEQASKAYATAALGHFKEFARTV